MNDAKPVVAILGGTGELGTGLAQRWLTAGYEVVIGSRSLEKATTAVEAIKQTLSERGIEAFNVHAMDNAGAAQCGDVVVITVPFSHHSSTLQSVKPLLQGKILIDVTVPLMPPKVARVQLPEQGSAGQMAQNLLGEGVRVVSAFQNVPAVLLQEPQALDCDVLVCGDSKEARTEVITLVEAAGMRGFHAGPVANAAAAEAMTSLLIFINRQYQCHAGIKITGIA